MKNFIKDSIEHKRRQFTCLVILVIFFFIVAFLSEKINAQDTSSVKKFHFEKIIVSEGKATTTSGFDVTICLSKKNKKNNTVLIVQANNERSNLRIGKQFGNFTVLATGGYFKNVPWTGPLFIYSNSWFDICSWTEVGFSKDKSVADPGFKTNFFLNYEEAGISIGKNRFAYAIQLFTTCPLSQYIIYNRNYLQQKFSHQ